jgi:hypothetical protein
MPTCFVIQPFDNGGPYDKRYRDVLVPAITKAELEPYRVDEDPRNDLVFENNFSDVESASRYIDSALAHGYEVGVTHGIANPSTL